MAGAAPAPDAEAEAGAAGVYVQCEALSAAALPALPDSDAASAAEGATSDAPSVSASTTTPPEWRGSSSEKEGSAQSASASAAINGGKNADGAGVSAPVAVAGSSRSASSGPPVLWRREREAALAACGAVAGSLSQLAVEAKKRSGNSAFPNCARALESATAALEMLQRHRDKLQEGLASLASAAESCQAARLQAAEAASALIAGFPVRQVVLAAADAARAEAPKVLLEAANVLHSVLKAQQTRLLRLPPASPDAGRAATGEAQTPSAAAGEGGGEELLSFSLSEERAVSEAATSDVLLLVAALEDLLAQASALSGTIQQQLFIKVLQVALLTATPGAPTASDAAVTYRVLRLLLSVLAAASAKNPPTSSAAAHSAAVYNTACAGFVQLIDCLVEGARREEAQHATEDRLSVEALLALPPGLLFDGESLKTRINEDLEQQDDEQQQPPEQSTEAATFEEGGRRGSSRFTIFMLLRDVTAKLLEAAPAAAAEVSAARERSAKSRRRAAAWLGSLNVPASMCLYPWQRLLLALPLLPLQVPGLLRLMKHELLPALFLLLQFQLSDPAITVRAVRLSVQLALQYLPLLQEESCALMILLSRFLDSRTLWLQALALDALGRCFADGAFLLQLYRNAALPSSRRVPPHLLEAFSRAAHLLCFSPSAEQQLLVSRLRLLDATPDEHALAVRKSAETLRAALPSLWNETPSLSLGSASQTRVVARAAQEPFPSPSASTDDLRERRESVAANKPPQSSSTSSLRGSASFGWNFSFLNFGVTGGGTASTSSNASASASSRPSSAGSASLSPTAPRLFDLCETLSASEAATTAAAVGSVEASEVLSLAISGVVCFIGTLYDLTAACSSSGLPSSQTERGWSSGFDLGQASFLQRAFELPLTEAQATVRVVAASTWGPSVSALALVLTAQASCALPSASSSSSFSSNSQTKGAERRSLGAGSSATTTSTGGVFSTLRQQSAVSVLLSAKKLLASCCVLRLDAAASAVVQAVARFCLYTAIGASGSSVAASPSEGARGATSTALASSTGSSVLRESFAWPFGSRRESTTTRTPTARASASNSFANPGSAAASLELGLAALARRFVDSALLDLGNVLNAEGWTLLLKALDELPVAVDEAAAQQSSGEEPSPKAAEASVAFWRSLGISESASLAAAGAAEEAAVAAACKTLCGVSEEGQVFAAASRRLSEEGLLAALRALDAQSRLSLQRAFSEASGAAGLSGGLSSPSAAASVEAEANGSGASSSSETLLACRCGSGVQSVCFALEANSQRVLGGSLASGVEATLASCSFPQNCSESGAGGGTEPVSAGLPPFLRRQLSVMLWNVDRLQQLPAALGFFEGFASLAAEASPGSAPLRVLALRALSLAVSLLLPAAAKSFRAAEAAVTTSDSQGEEEEVALAEELKESPFAFAEAVLQCRLIAPLCAVTAAPSSEGRAEALRALRRLAGSRGQLLRPGGWLLMLCAVGVAARLQLPSHLAEAVAAGADEASAAASEENACKARMSRARGRSVPSAPGCLTEQAECLALAELVVQEFAEEIPLLTAWRVVAAAVAALGSGDAHSAAFRCVGFLWSLADGFSKRENNDVCQAHAKAAAEAARSLAAEGLDAPFTFALASFAPLQGGAVSEQDKDSLLARLADPITGEALAAQVYRHLRWLALDARAEYRHCALRSLTSALRSLSAQPHLAYEGWLRTRCGILESTLRRVQEVFLALHQNPQQRSAEGARDGAEGQTGEWAETLVIAVDGVRVLLLHFSSALLQPLVPASEAEAENLRRAEAVLVEAGAGLLEVVSGLFEKTRLLTPELFIASTRALRDMALLPQAHFEVADGLAGESAGEGRCCLRRLAWRGLWSLAKALLPPLLDGSPASAAVVSAPNSDVVFRQRASVGSQECEVVLQSLTHLLHNRRDGDAEAAVESCTEQAIAVQVALGLVSSPAVFARHSKPLLPRSSEDAQAERRSADEGSETQSQGRQSPFAESDAEESSSDAWGAVRSEVACFVQRADARLLALSCSASSSWSCLSSSASPPPQGDRAPLGPAAVAFALPAEDKVSFLSGEGGSATQSALGGSSPQQPVASTNPFEAEADCAPEKNEEEGVHRASRSVACLVRRLLLDERLAAAACQKEGLDKEEEERRRVAEAEAVTEELKSLLPFTCVFRVASVQTLAIAKLTEILALPAELSDGAAQSRTLLICRVFLDPSAVFRDSLSLALSGAALLLLCQALRMASLSAARLSSPRRTSCSPSPEGGGKEEESPSSPSPRSLQQQWVWNELFLCYGQVIDAAMALVRTREKEAEARLKLWALAEQFVCVFLRDAISAARAAASLAALGGGVPSKEVMDRLWRSAASAVEEAASLHLRQQSRSLEAQSKAAEEETRLLAALDEIQRQIAKLSVTPTLQTRLPQPFASTSLEGGPPSGGSSSLAFSKNVSQTRGPQLVPPFVSAQQTQLFQEKRRLQEQLARVQNKRRLEGGGVREEDKELALDGAEEETFLRLWILRVAAKLLQQPLGAEAAGRVSRLFRKWINGNLVSPRDASCVFDLLFESCEDEFLEEETAPAAAETASPAAKGPSGEGALLSLVVEEAHAVVCRFAHSAEQGEQPTTESSSLLKKILQRLRSLRCLPASAAAFGLNDERGQVLRLAGPKAHLLVLLPQLIRCVACDDRELRKEVQLCLACATEALSLSPERIS